MEIKDTINNRKKDENVHKYAVRGEKRQRENIFYENFVSVRDPKYCIPLGSVHGITKRRYRTRKCMSYKDTAYLKRQ